MSVLEKKIQGLKHEIKSAIVKAGIQLDSELPDILLEVPREKAHGDFATNIAMQLARSARMNPRVLAAAIVEKIDQKKVGIKKIEIAGPGFINFFLDRSFLIEVLDDISQSGIDYGRNPRKTERILVEFVSANPTGSLHLGHARGAAIGDSLCNILDFAGYDVTREYYINDAGNQIHMMTLSLEARYLEALGLPYQLPEEGYHGEDIAAMGRALAAEEGDRLVSLEREERLKILREYGLNYLLKKIKEDLRQYRVSFDHWFSETSLYESKKIEVTLEKLKAHGHIYEKDGATWFRSSSLGDDKDRVLVKRDGSYTYLLPDIAYHQDKLNRGFDRVINVWGADHHGYIPRMKAAFTAMGEDPRKSVVVISQMVQLYQGGERVKMSKRTGKAVTLAELMEEVGVDAMRYFFAMRSPDTHMDFDMDLAVAHSNENPVFYVQYAYARICSVFRQAERKQISFEMGTARLDLLTEEQEYDLLQQLAEFPGEVVSAAEQLAPNRITNYLHELASSFHSYYNANRIISEDHQKTVARMALLKGIAQVIENGLRLIGVNAPEKM